MDNQVRLLGIVPYEGMKTLLLRLAEEYPQVDLDVFVGNMEEGVEIAQSKFHNQYDAVISRGGTAKALRKLSVPVVEIEISLYDILYALKLSGGLHSKFAMVAYADIAIGAQALCDLLHYQADIFIVNSIEELEPTLRYLKENQYDTVLCDMTADIIARSIGLNTIFITSGMESIRQALDRALALCRSRKHLQDENTLFRALLSGQGTQVAVFDQQGQMVFFQGEEETPELLDLLQQELNELPAGKERRITRSVGKAQYTLRIRPITAGERYTAVYMTARKSVLGKSQTGIRFFSCQEAEQKVYSSLFSFRELYVPSAEDAPQLTKSMAPVIIAGEDGTCMSHAAARLYVEGPLRDAPLVSINCCLLNDKGWEFLLESHNSPLSESGNTLYFSRIGALSQARRLQLMDTLAEADVCRRNRVLFSCTCRPGEQMSPEGAEFLDRLHCRVLYLRPLRDLKEQIPTQITSSLSLLNASRPYPVLGAEPEAIQLLQSFPWPHNYVQFQRVIEELAAAAEQTITAQSVREILQRESYGNTHASRMGDMFEPLDLSQTLEQISRDVALRVLAETNGNQSAAAKRLEISRTTLRRLIKQG